MPSSAECGGSRTVPNIDNSTASTTSTLEPSMPSGSNTNSTLPSISSGTISNELDHLKTSSVRPKEEVDNISPNEHIDANHPHHTVIPLQDTELMEDLLEEDLISDSESDATFSDDSTFSWGDIKRDSDDLSSDTEPGEVRAMHIPRVVDSDEDEEEYSESELEAMQNDDGESVASKPIVLFANNIDQTGNISSAPTKPDNIVVKTLDDFFVVPELAKVKSKTKKAVHTKSTDENVEKANEGTSRKRARACGECEACHAVDCLRCVYCKDMRKYGGPGRLKQKCKAKQCTAMKRGRADNPRRPRKRRNVDLDFFEEEDSPESFAFEDETSLIEEADEIHLEAAQLSTGEAEIPAEQGEVSAEATKSVERTADAAETSIETKAILSAFETKVPQTSDYNVPKVVECASEKSYNELIRQQASEVRKIKNCGDCLNCLDKKEFGGPGRKKQMCMEKKAELQRRVAQLAVPSQGDGSPERPLHGRTSSRKRKVTRKMEESLDQEWSGRCCIKMHPSRQ